ncbi:MAG: hypothetical protein IKG70_04215 [Lachnospiraceae bacterium]|nr:hypothetical protein [Lachnospiraceae bacterium]
MNKTNLKKRWIGFGVIGVSCLVIGLSLSGCSQKMEESVLKSEVTEEQSEPVKAKETKAVSSETDTSVLKDRPAKVPAKEDQKKTEPSKSPTKKTDPDTVKDSEEKTEQTASVKKVEKPEKEEDQKPEDKETQDSQDMAAPEKPEEPEPVQEPETPAQTPEPEKEEHHHTYFIAGETAPTCTSVGKRTYACSCGLTYDEPIAMLDHDWVPVTETVHHDAEVKPAWDETVSEAWDEPVYENHSFCNVCGIDLDVLEQNGTDRGDHIWDDHDGMAGWHDEDVQVDTIHHKAENVHHSEEVISPAWDEEVVTGYRCSVCGTVR